MVRDRAERGGQGSAQEGSVEPGLGTLATVPRAFP